TSVNTGIPGVTTPYANPYGVGAPGSEPYNPYSPYGSYIANPLGDTLRGAAAAVNANGNFMLQQQQTWILYEQRRQAAVDTRRKIYDEWLYERATAPDPTVERSKWQQAQLSRALLDPSMPEVLSGDTLNTLY